MNTHGLFKKVLPFIMSALLFSCSGVNSEEMALSCLDRKFSVQDVRVEKVLRYIDSSMVAQKYIPDPSCKSYCHFYASHQQALIHVKGDTALEKWIDQEKPNNLIFLRCYQEAFAKDDSEDGKRFYDLMEEMEKAGEAGNLLLSFYQGLKEEFFARPAYKYFFLFLLMADRTILVDYPETNMEPVSPHGDTVAGEVPMVEFTPPQPEAAPVEE